MATYGTEVEGDEDAMEDIDDDFLTAWAQNWARWLKSEWHIQALTWLVSTSSVAYVAATSPATGGWTWWGGFFGMHDWELLSGWLVASAMASAQKVNVLCYVLVTEQRAMSFQPWSLLFFSALLEPTVGSTVIFMAWDGRTYVRNVREVHNELGKPIVSLKTSGDLEGAPGDQPLYSPDGTKEWLDRSQVHGTMVAGPLLGRRLLAVLVVMFTISPSFFWAFFFVSHTVQVMLFSFILNVLMLFGLALLDARC
eukprot:TRINITY_DN67511_c0_g1_i1.p1 TRINITY_DN67511_c0_g1~~TRINITY_DN67511_c0_g1_i1.p1  ORF type:complete len:253 (-),score=39.09 TRINITY_DN67511_c0_g1_i1:180-938(-)